MMCLHGHEQDWLPGREPAHIREKRAAANGK
jgi:hypothetical protein